MEGGHGGRAAPSIAMDLPYQLVHTTQQEKCVTFKVLPLEICFHQPVLPPKSYTVSKRQCQLVTSLQNMNPCWAFQIQTIAETEYVQGHIVGHGVDRCFCVEEQGGKSFS